MKSVKKRYGAEGSVLVEAILAMLIMLTMVLGGAAFFFHSSGKFINDRDKRIALEEANARLEQMYGSSYNSIKPPAEDYTTYFLKRSGDDWVKYETDPDETVDICGSGVPIITTVKFVDADLSDPDDTYDYILAVVRIEYRPNANETVELRAILAR